MKYQLLLFWKCLQYGKSDHFLFLELPLHVFLIFVQENELDLTGKKLFSQHIRIGQRMKLAIN